MDLSQLEQAYIELGRILLVNKMCQAATITCLVYDFLITFDKEVEYIWKKPKARLSTFLYIWLRYLGTTLGLFSSTVFFIDKPSLADFLPFYWFVSLKVITTIRFVMPSCEVFMRMDPWPTWMVVCTVQAMLQIRLYALYERSNKILAFMAVFFLAEVSSQLYAYITLDSTVQVTNQPLPGVYSCASSVYGSPSYGMFLTLAFESMVFCLSIWVGYRHSKVKISKLQLWSRAHIIDIIVQGNVLYYLGFTLLFVFAMVTFFIYGMKWGTPINAFTLATFVIGGCHLILHLLDAASPTSRSPQQLSARPIFACPTSTMSHA